MSTLETFIKSGVDPFAEDPLPKAYYHPSTEKRLSKNEKKTCLSPDRLVKLKTYSNSEKDTMDPGPGVEKFLQQTNSLSYRELPTHDTPSPRDTSSKFNESWPSSERPSTITSPENDRPQSVTGPQVSLASLLSITTESVDRYRQHNEPPEPVDSTLARYIHRFRYGEPKSRKDRQKDEKQQEFWWLSPPDKSSTPTGDTTPGTSRGRSPRRGQRHAAKSPKSPYYKYTGKRQPGDIRRQPGDIKNSSSTISRESNTSLEVPMYVPVDRLTHDLQQRAQKLIDKSEFLSEPRVSSDGLESSPSFSSYQDEESVYQPRLTLFKHSIQDKENIIRPIGGNKLCKPESKLACEDDILYQWRLRCKLDVARQDVDTPGPLHGVRSTSPPVRLSPYKPRVPVQDNSVSDDIDSKLWEFRQRMAGQREISHIQLTSRQPIMTSGRSMESRKEHKGSDPIPQSIATQTSPKEDNKAVSSMQDKCHSPVRDMRYELPTRLHLTPEKPSATSQLQIASPYVQQDESEDENVVTPHLHLICDLLPCPHQVKVQESPRKSHAENKERGSSNVLNDKQVVSTSNEEFGKFLGSEDSPSKVCQQLDFDKKSGDGMLKKRLPTSRNITQTSTPKAVPGSPISTAIGQVVGSRLFSSPQKSEHSSPYSSMESVPTMRSLSIPQRQVEGQTLSSSENSDFEDDELLQLLYRKQTHYEEQLEQIDQILSEKLATSDSQSGTT